MDVASGPTKIKFCGITNLKDAQLAHQLGAWAIGLILWPGSPRRCTPAAGVEIAAVLKRRLEVVGVFVNPTLEEVVALSDEIGLTAIQLHGDEGPSFCAQAARRTGCKLIKAMRVRSRADIQALVPFRTDYHLLDSHVPGHRGGTGETFAWELARAHRGTVPLMLSGGLTPDNVAQAIRIVEPFAVDVASGVEAAPGRKDPLKLEVFAKEVAGAHVRRPGSAHAPTHGAAHARPRTTIN